VYIQGAWDDLLAPVCEIAERAKEPIDIPDDYMIIPLHILQVANIYEKFPEARILPEEYHVETLAQKNLRYISLVTAITTWILKEFCCADPYSFLCAPQSEARDGCTS
jgi:hypothetical protein